MIYRQILIALINSTILFQYAQKLFKVMQENITNFNIDMN